MNKIEAALWLLNNTLYIQYIVLIHTALLQIICKNNKQQQTNNHINLKEKVNAMAAIRQIDDFDLLGPKLTRMHLTTCLHSTDRLINQYGSFNRIDQVASVSLIITLHLSICSYRSTIEHESFSLYIKIHCWTSLCNSSSCCRFCCCC